MRASIIGLCVVVAAVTGAACSSDDAPASTSASTSGSIPVSTPGSATGGASDRGATVDAIVASATASDIEVDEACVATVVDQFSTADYVVLAANATDPDVSALSTPGQTLIVELVNCTGGKPGGTIPAPGGLSTAQVLILDQIKAGFDSQGLAYDETCLADVVNSVDTATIANQALAADLVTQARACIKQ